MGVKKASLKGVTNKENKLIYDRLGIYEIDADIFSLKPVFIFQRLAVATILLINNLSYINLFFSVGDSL